jgi:hypothetical protein
MTWDFIYIGILWTDKNNQLLMTPHKKNLTSVIQKLFH